MILVNAIYDIVIFQNLNFVNSELFTAAVGLNSPDNEISCLRYLNVIYFLTLR